MCLVRSGVVGLLGRHRCCRGLVWQRHLLQPPAAAPASAAAAGQLGGCEAQAPHSCMASGASPAAGAAAAAFFCCFLPFLPAAGCLAGDAPSTCRGSWLNKRAAAVSDVGEWLLAPGSACSWQRRCAACCRRRSPAGQLLAVSDKLQPPLSHLHSRLECSRLLARHPLCVGHLQPAERGMHQTPAAEMVGMCELTCILVCAWYPSLPKLYTKGSIQAAHMWHQARMAHWSSPQLTHLALVLLGPLAAHARHRGRLVLLRNTQGGA